MRTTLHLTTALAVVAAGLTVMAAPASAVVPTNDTIAKALTIKTLPFRVEADVSRSTRADSDPRPSCDHSVRHTVWWKVTAPADGWMAADTLGSRYDTLAAVYSGTPRELSEVACNDDSVRDGDWTSKARVYWHAEAASTYYLMIAAGFGHAGLLRLHVGRSAAPFTVDSFAIDPQGYVDQDSNTPVVSGTLVCSHRSGTVSILAYIQQRVGRTYIDGGAYKNITCDGTTPWRMRFKAYNGVFRGGYAEVSGYLWWYEGNGSEVEIGPLDVHLSG